MVFTRRVPTRTYSDYTRYRPLLRQDFQNRCAYCLRHEYFVGGEAGCAIDHHRPQGGPYARPDLVSVYENLYWCCTECNNIKADTWPSAEEWAVGRRFLDPCQLEDDHDLHWGVEEDGTLVALTGIGEYTIGNLVLEREGLVYHRRRQIRWEREYAELTEALEKWEMDESLQAAIESRLAELRAWIEPPVFNRATRPSFPA